MDDYTERSLRLDGGVDPAVLLRVGAAEGYLSRQCDVVNEPEVKGVVAAPASIGV